jgi:hypothetical protein
MERTERTKNHRERDIEPEEHEAGTCGSCHWARIMTQFNVPRPSCTVLPKQAVAVANQVAFVNPVIENPKDSCSMWTPKPNGADLDG